MMRCPSAYCATSSGMSRSIMRSKTQPTRPAELRTRYQSSMAGFGGDAASLADDEDDALGATFGGVAAATGGAEAACVPAFGAGFLGCCVPDFAALAAAAAFGGFFSAVARFRTST